MKIESIMLENIRSHVKTLINFSDGFNCLVGGVGTGKTSILYAIDFALFGEPLGRSYEYLLREGDDVGKVALNFVQNGKKYTIWRALKRQNGRISQDTGQLKLFEGERLIAELKSDAVAEQLKAITDIDRSIFHEIIWVRQEHLKDVLDLPPRERQGKLDQLFGLYDYEISWTNLRPISGWYESESASLERDPDIAGIRDLQAKYEESVKDLASKESELEEAKQQLSGVEAKLKEVSSHLEELEAIRRKNEEFKAAETEIQLKIRNIESLSLRLVNEIETRRKRKEELEKRLESLKIQENDNRRKIQEIGLSSDLNVEQIQDYIEGLIGQISSTQSEEESAKNEIKKITQRISNLAKESRCPLCLQSLTFEYKDRIMKQFYQELSETKQRLSERERNIRELESVRSILSSAISDLRMIHTKIDGILIQIEDEDKLINNALEEFNEKQKEAEMLKGQLAELRLKIMEFDLTKLEDAENLYKAIFEQYSNLKYKVQNIESQKNQVFLRLESLKERLDIAQKKIDRLEKVKKIIGLIQEIRQAYRSIQPKLRSEFVTYLERVIQQVLDELTGDEGSIINLKIDENYTPLIEAEGGQERNALNLSGGERTLLAFAYRIGIGQLIMQWRSGHGLRMLLLDEPTESLGREDGSIDRLAESISRLKTVEQVIAVTHSEAFAEKADRVIRLEKRNNQSTVLVER